MKTSLSRLLPLRVNLLLRVNDSEFALLANDCDESAVCASEFEFASAIGCELAIEASSRGVSRLEDADASSALLLRASLKASRA